MIEVVNSGTGIEIRKGILRGAGHVLYLNLGGDEKGVFICNKLLSYILEISVLAHLGYIRKHPRVSGL